MPFDFPASPTEGQEFTPAGGPTYVFTSPVWLVKNGALIGDAPNDGKQYGRQNTAWTQIDARIRLTTSTTLYVSDAIGNDATSVGNSALPFKTWQGAYDYLCAKIDTCGNDVTLQLLESTPQTFAAGIFFGDAWVGGGNLTVVGNSSTPANCAVNGNFTVNATLPGKLQLVGFKLTGTNTNLVWALAPCQVELNTIEFVGPGANYSDIYANHPGAQITLTYNLKFSGTAAYALRADNGGCILSNYFSFTLLTVPSFQSAFVQATTGGFINLFGSSFTGTATGKKFIVGSGGNIQAKDATSASDQTRLPGSLPGQLLPSGIYDDTVNGPKEKLLAARTYYVRSDGSDSNDGRSNTATGAFRTIQYAVNWIQQNIDFGYYVCTLQLQAVTWTEAVTVFGPFDGNNPLLIQGSNVSLADAANYKWGSSARTLYIRLGARVNIQGIEISSTGDSALLAEDAGSVLWIGSYMRFGAVPSAHMWAYGGGKVQCRAPGYNIVGNAGQHCRVDQGGMIDVQPSSTVTITAAVSIGIFVYAATAGGLITCYPAGGFTNPGNVTGQKYQAAYGGGIFVNGAGVNYFPGTTAGAVTAPGWYA